MFDRIQKTVLPLAALAGALAGCAATAPGTRPDDMSAHDHHRVAAARRAEATEHEARFDPAAERTRAAAPALAEFEIGSATENPTAHHLVQAKELRRHAEAHAAAARALERAEAEACATVPPETAATCPLRDAVVAAEPVAGGARLSLREGVDADELLPRIRCHLSRARTLGFEGMESCPLSVRGLSARVSRDGEAIELLSGEAVSAIKTYSRARALVEP